MFLISLSDSIYKTSLTGFGNTLQMVLFNEADPDDVIDPIIFASSHVSRVVIHSLNFCISPAKVSG